MDYIYAFVLATISLTIYAPLSMVFFKKNFTMAWEEYCERIFGIIIGLLTLYCVTVIS